MVISIIGYSQADGNDNLKTSNKCDTLLFTSGSRIACIINSKYDGKIKFSPCAEPEKEYEVELLKLDSIIYANPVKKEVAKEETKKEVEQEIFHEETPKYPWKKSTFYVTNDQGEIIFNRSIGDKIEVNHKNNNGEVITTKGYISDIEKKSIKVEGTIIRLNKILEVSKPDISKIMFASGGSILAVGAITGLVGILLPDPTNCYICLFNNVEVAGIFISAGGGSVMVLSGIVKLGAVASGKKPKISGTNKYQTFVKE
jgi:hypothetical protein